MYWWVALVVSIEDFTTIMTICLWFFLQKNGEWIPEKTSSSIFCQALGQVFRYNLGTVLAGSFIIAMVWTVITMVNVYKEFIKSLLSHDKLEKFRD